MRSHRLAIIGLLGLAATSAMARFDARFVVKVGGFGPRTEVRFARPTLKWEIWPAETNAKVKTVELKLDGKAVDAGYDQRARAVTYTPTAPLTPGSHRVECRITFDNGFHFDQNWETKIAESPISDFPTPIATQTEALDVANRLRAMMGLPAMQVDDRLNLASLQHSQYLSRNNMVGHGEKPGTPGFLGQSGADRLEAYGWIGSSWEGVNFGADTASESVHNLFDAPYHRIPFMQPGAVTFGSGFADKNCTVEFSASDEVATVVSPANGQKGIPCAWRNFERPNPLRVHGVDVKETGYPIVFSQFGPDMPHLASVKATLTAPDGASVSCWLNTPSNDDTLTGSAILIPQQRLRPNTAYTAKFSATDSNGKAYESSVVFTTGAK